MNDIGSMVGVSAAKPSGHLTARVPGSSHLLTAAALIAADLIAFAVAGLLFRVNRSVPLVVLLPNPPEVGRPTDIFYALALVFIVARYIYGDYTRRRLFWDRARATTTSLLLAATPCFAIVALLPDQYSIGAEVGTWGFLLFAVPMCRQGCRIVLDRLGLWRLPTALIATSPRYEDVFNTINETLTLGCRINWLAVKAGRMPPASNQHAPRLLRIEDPRSLANQLYDEGCRQAIVATDAMQSEEFADLIQRLMEVGIAVSFIPSFRRLPLVGVTTSYFFGKETLLFQVRSSLEGTPSKFAKRAFDVVASLAGLILLLPLFAAVAIAIKRHDGGPVIYAPTRTGRNGKQFRCYKFRSMAVDADQRLERWRTENPDLYSEFQKNFKLVDDPRITAPGAWLRKTSLDELPQLLNVLAGDMSLVGPRPVLEQELKDFYGPATMLYKRVRPGLTGLWQVRGRSDVTYEERVLLDEWYILNWSFWYDVVILVQTVAVVLLRKGAY